MSKRVYVYFHEEIQPTNFVPLMRRLDLLEGTFESASGNGICSRALRSRLIEISNSTLNLLKRDPYNWDINRKVSVHQLRALSSALTEPKRIIRLSCHSMVILRSMFVVLYNHGNHDFDDIVEIANAIKSLVNKYYTGDDELMRFLLESHTALMNEISLGVPVEDVSSVYLHLLERTKL